MTSLHVTTINVDGAGVHVRCSCEWSESYVVGEERVHAGIMVLVTTRNALELAELRARVHRASHALE